MSRESNVFGQNVWALVLSSSAQLWCLPAFLQNFNPCSGAAPSLSHLTGVPESRAVASQSCSPRIWSKLSPSPPLYSMAYNIYMTLISQDLLSSGTELQDICSECLLDHTTPSLSLFGSAHTYRRGNLNSLCSITHERLQHSFQTWPILQWRDQVSQKHFALLLNTILISAMGRCAEPAPWAGGANSVLSHCLRTWKSAWLLELCEETAGFGASN